MLPQDSRTALVSATSTHMAPTGTRLAGTGGSFPIGTTRKLLQDSTRSLFFVVFLGVARALKRKKHTNQIASLEKDALERYSRT